MKHTILICPDYWEDIKSLQKKYKVSETRPLLNYSDEVDELTKITNIPLLEKTVTYISNILSDGLTSQFDKWDIQPYINSGWIIYKVRYGFAGRGKRDGLRILVAECKEKGLLLQIFIQMKSDCSNEPKLQKEVLSRLENYFGTSA